MWRGRLLTVLGAALIPLVLPATTVGRAADAPGGRATASATEWQQESMPMVDPSGHLRHFWVRRPVGAWRGVRPAVAFFGGLGRDPLAEATSVGMTELADDHGLVLLVGDGWQESWAAGGCCGPAAGVPSDLHGGAVVHAPTAVTQDVHYVDVMLATARRDAVLQAGHIPVVGYSNGGMLAARWACASNSGRIAVSVSGPLLVACQHKTTLLHVHSSNDTIVPLHGGVSSRTHTVFPDTSREATRLPHGSRYDLWIEATGHHWPAGLSQRIYTWIQGELAED